MSGPELFKFPPTLLFRAVRALAVSGGCALLLPGCGGGCNLDTVTGQGPTFGVIVTVSGLSGSGLVLQNRGTDNLAVSANGTVAFSQRLASGAGYAVTVLNDPDSPAQWCQVNQGGGTIAASNISNITVVCSNGTHTAYVASAGNNTVSQFAVSPVDGRLSAIAPGTAVTDTPSPSSVTMDPTGRFAYVANAGSNTVSQYTVSAVDGSLTAMVPATVTTGTSPSAVTVDPTGRFAYVANAGSNTVSQYTVSATNGALSALAPDVTTGPGPVGVAVAPSGRYAYVANSGNATVSQYAIALTTGILTPLAPAAVNTDTSPSSVSVR